MGSSVIKLKSSSNPSAEVLGEYSKLYSIKTSHNVTVGSLLSKINTNHIEEKLYNEKREMRSPINCIKQDTYISCFNS